MAYVMHARGLLHVMGGCDLNQEQTCDRLAMKVTLTSTLLISTLLSWSVSLADQIVSLERPNVGPIEPYFDPKSINANVGEQIHFIANFNLTTKVLLFANSVLLITLEFCSVYVVIWRIRLWYSMYI